MSKAPVGIVSDVSFEIVVVVVSVVVFKTVTAQERRKSQLSPFAKEEETSAEELEARATIAEAMCGCTLFLASSRILFVVSVTYRCARTGLRKPCSNDRNPRRDVESGTSGDKEEEEPASKYAKSSSSSSMVHP